MEISTIPEIWRLIYYFVLPVFRNRVGIALAGGKHVTYHPCRFRLMAIEKIFANQRAMRSESLTRALVHINDDSVAVTYRDCAIGLLGP